MAKANYCSTVGMKELPLPEPVKCPLCDKYIGWYINDDQKHYTTNNHLVWENLDAVIYHSLYLVKPRYV